MRNFACNSLCTLSFCHRSKAQEPVVYNAATLDCTWDDMIKKSRRASWTFPYPTFGIRGMTSIASLYWILVLFLEWLPSVLCDIVLGLCGRKQRYCLRGRENLSRNSASREFIVIVSSTSLFSALWSCRGITENLARPFRSPSPDFVRKMLERKIVEIILLPVYSFNRYPTIYPRAHFVKTSQAGHHREAALA